MWWWNGPSVGFSIKEPRYREHQHVIHAIFFLLSFSVRSSNLSPIMGNCLTQNCDSWLMLQRTLAWSLQPEVLIEKMWFFLDEKGLEAIATKSTSNFWEKKARWLLSQRQRQWTGSLSRALFLGEVWNKLCWTDGYSPSPSHLRLKRNHVCSWNLIPRSQPP